MMAAQAKKIDAVFVFSSKHISEDYDLSGAFMDALNKCDVVVYDKADGTPIHKSAVAKTQKELLQKIKVIKEQYDGVDLSEECYITLREWFNKWLDECH